MKCRVFLKMTRHTRSRSSVFTHLLTTSASKITTNITNCPILYVFTYVCMNLSLETDSATPISYIRCRNFDRWAQLFAYFSLHVCSFDYITT